MEKLLVNIALATAIFEEQKNYLDTYHPFIIKIFASKSCYSIEEISSNLKTFEINLPIHSIKNILVRKENNIYKINKSSKASWEITLSQKGITELNSLIVEEKKIETQLSSFYLSFIDFSEKEFKQTYDLNDVEDLVIKFIQRNIIDISINTEDKHIHDHFNGFDKTFVLFLSHIKKTNLELTVVFDKIWKGTVIWNELRKEDLQKVSLKFGQRIAVYVDTNFVFSLLGFHNPLINKAAEELYNLLISTQNIDLYILDITIKELWSIFDLYPSFKDDYYDIEVDSVFYYLKKKSYSLAKVDKLKDNLIDTLKSKYKISFVESEILDDTKQQWYAEIYDHLYKIRSEINKRKPSKLHKTNNAIERNAHHDTSAIIHTLSKKNRNATNLENCKSLFLTSGFWLYKNYKNIHSKFEGFPSIILDSVLTNILYLKNPEVNIGISIDQVIKTHCNYLIIDHNIWTLFISYAKELVQDKKIDVEDYSRLVSKNQLSQDALVDVSPNDINQQKVLEILDSIKVANEEKQVEVEEYKTDITLKDKTIGDLFARVASLEQENRKSKAELKYKDDLNEYNSRIKTFIDEEWSKEIRNVKKSLIWYLVFIFISIIVFSFAYLFNFNSVEIQKEYNFSPSVIKNISFLLAGLIFLIPFIRSFFNHKHIFYGLKMISKNFRTKKKEQFDKENTEVFKKENKEPLLADYYKS